MWEHRENENGEVIAFRANALRSWLVRAEGLEPPSREALDPKSSVSTNFTTPAFCSDESPFRGRQRYVNSVQNEKYWKIVIRPEITEQIPELQMQYHRCYAKIDYKACYVHKRSYKWC